MDIGTLLKQILGIGQNDQTQNIPQPKVKKQTGWKDGPNGSYLPVFDDPNPQYTGLPVPKPSEYSHSLSDYTRSEIPTSPTNLVPIMNSVAEKYNIPSTLIPSILFQESGMRLDAPNNYNDNGSYDRGIAQINSSAHPDITDQQAADPNFAIDFVGKTLADNYKQTNDWGTAIRAYNAGLAGAQSGGGQDYLQGIKANMSSDAVKALGL